MLLESSSRFSPRHLQLVYVNTSFFIPRSLLVACLFRQLILVMSFRGFFRRGNNNPSSTNPPTTTTATSSLHLNQLSRLFTPDMNHRPAMVPSHNLLPPSLANLHIPNRWLLEVSHLIQMLDLLVSRLTSLPPTPPPTPARRLSVASVLGALDRLHIHHRRSSQPERTIVTEIYADVEAITSYRVKQIESSRLTYFLERIMTARGQLATLGAAEIVEVVDRVIALMREWQESILAARQGTPAAVISEAR